MQVTHSEVHPAGRFWIAWAARDLLLLAAAGAYFVGGSYWRTPQLQSPPADPPPKATAIRGPITPDPDRELTTKIRKAIAKDQTLSSEALELKIVVRNGVVILKGVVPSEEQEATLISEAARLAGASNIRSQLTVKPQDAEQVSEESRQEPQQPQQQSQEPQQ